MKRLVVLALCLMTTAVFAQEKDADREKRFQEDAKKGIDTTKQVGWYPAGVVGLDMTQVSFKDWAAGGENTLAYRVYGTGGAVHYAEKTRWSNMLKLTYGQSKVGAQEIRKSDDEIYFESLLIYVLGSTINPYVSVTTRTQFAPGFTYPSGLPREQISDFFDPAYLTQSAGVAYTPVANLTTRLGLGLREVVTSRFKAFANDASTPVSEWKSTRIDGGLESVTDFSWPFAENMMFITRLEMFAPFKEFDRVIIRNDNTIAMKVNKVVTVNFNVQLVNDVNVTPRTQVKQALSVGVSYALW